MRVFVRKRASDVFLADGNRWVSDRQDALNFVSSIMALNTATRMQLDDIEIVLDFSGRGSDVVLDVPNNSKNAPHSG
jgi:hypothetical protein